MVPGRIASGRLKVPRANPSEGVADESKTARPQTLLLLIFCIYKFGKWQKKGNKTLAD